MARPSTVQTVIQGYQSQNPGFDGVKKNRTGCALKSVSDAVFLTRKPLFFKA